jgi:hypothetical protein
MTLAAACFAQAIVAPYDVSRLKMLAGVWKAAGKGGMVEFQYDMNAGMIGRARPDNQSAWHRMMVIHHQDDKVRADFYDMKGNVIHYNLDLADGPTLRFVEDAAPPATQRRIVYRQDGPDRLLYRFETGGKVTDSGVLVATAELRPLTE